MPAVLLYFQLHQPFRLRKYTVFDTDHAYFDAKTNAALLRKFAETVYLPLLRLLHALLHPVITDPNAPAPPPFKVALSLTATLVEQLEIHAPEALHLLHTLAASPYVEFLAETSHHSLATLRSPGEALEQINLHRQMLKRLFNLAPNTLRNTDLIYDNTVASLASQLGFSAILAEGYEPALDHRSAAFPYTAHLDTSAHPDAPSPPPITLLLRNHPLSQSLLALAAIAPTPDPRHPTPDTQPPTPTADSLAHQIASIGGPLCNLFLPAEALAAPNGPALLSLLAELPARLAQLHCPFLLPSQVPAYTTNAGPLSLPSPISWTDPHRDLSAFLGNAMQQNAADELYKLETPLKSHPDPKLLADWRKLTTADHLLYMSTLDPAHHTLHLPTPYESPYDAYINFMNILDNLRLRAS